MFESNARLSVLSLHGNLLISMDAGSFDKLTSLVDLDISSNNINNFPPLIFSKLSSLASLNLANNELTALPDDLLDGLDLMQRPSLEISDLSFNLVRRIHSYTFSGAQRLRQVHLDNNRLLELHKFSFVDMNRLEILNIARNNITKMLNMTFVNLTSLIYLDMSSNQISIIETNPFVNCVKLQYLILTDNYVTSIPQFDNFLKIAILKLNLNFITKFENDSLKSFPSLKHLSLEHQQIGTTPTNLPSNIFHFTPDIQSLNLQQCSLSLLNVAYNSVSLVSLKKLNLSRNLLTSLQNFSFTGIIVLTELDLSHNLISFIDVRAFEGLSNLKILILKNNKITSIFPTIQSFQCLPQLEILVLPSNNISDLHSDSIDEFLQILANLTFIDLGCNNLSKLTIPSTTLAGNSGFIHPSQITTLSLNNNKLHSFPETAERFFMDLTGLNLDYNLIRDSSELRLTSLIRLQVGRFAGNLLSKLDDEFLENSSNSLMELDVRDNLYLTSDVFFVFKKFVALKVLRISNNSIQRFASTGSESIYVSIEELYADTNIIQSEYLSDLKSFPSLRILNLDNNRITTFPKQVLDMRRLEVLSSRKNMITFLDPSTFKDPPTNIFAFLLSNNLIQNLDETIFDDFTDLRIIDLSSNQLSRISFPASLPSLEQMLLQNNNILLLNDTPLTNFKMKNLKLVNLSQNKLNSDMSDVNGGISIKTHNTPLTLDLSFNKLTSTKELSFLGYFDSILLRGNDLKSSQCGSNESRFVAESVDLSINSIISQKVSSLNTSICLNDVKQLDLKHNEISQFMPAMHTGCLDTLESLDLSFNKISSIDPFVFINFSSLKRLSLGGNNLVCGCEVIQMIRTLANNSIQLTSLDCLDAKNNSLPQRCLNYEACDHDQNTSSVFLNDTSCRASPSTHFPRTALPPLTVTHSNTLPIPRNQAYGFVRSNWGLLVGLPCGLILIIVVIIILTYLVVMTTRSRRDQREKYREILRSFNGNLGAATGLERSRPRERGLSSNSYYDHFGGEEKVAYVKFKDRALFPIG